MAQLTTHVLDTARGVPAAGIGIALYSVRGDARRLIKTVVTNADGRTDGALLSGETIECGVYELIFQAGDYFRAAGLQVASPPFLDEVLIRFGISEPGGKYHVPLLLSPFGYSTYRGS